jgi:hypothetical protein
MDGETTGKPSLGLSLKVSWTAQILCDCQSFDVFRTKEIKKEDFKLVDGDERKVVIQEFNKRSLIDIRKNWRLLRT